MSTTRERLERARCSGCPDFDTTCVTCVRRYFQQLIDENYAPAYLVEDLDRKLAAASAMGVSFKTEADDLRRQRDDLHAEVGRHHRDFERISALVDRRAAVGELTAVEREIRGIVG